MRLRISKEFLGNFNCNESHDDFSNLIKIYVWLNSKEEGHDNLIMIIEKEWVTLCVEEDEFIQMYGQYGMKFIVHAKHKKEKYEKTKSFKEFED